MIKGVQVWVQLIDRQRRSDARLVAGRVREPVESSRADPASSHGHQ